MRRLSGHFARAAAVLAAGFCAYSAQAETACQPVPGLDAALKSPAHIIWFGELHGTNEAPDFFADAVCAASQDGRKILVALERPTAEDGPTQVFLGMPDKDQATSVLLTGFLWRNRLQDGRSSEGMLASMLRLRDYQRSGRLSDVVLIDLPSGPGLEEQVMAETVKATAATNPDARVLVYTGNFHARKTPAGDTHPAASLLPPGTVYSIDVIGKSGTAWNYDNGGAHPVEGADAPRGIVASHDSSYDAQGFLGVPMTASPPVLQAALDLTRPVQDALVRLDAEQAKLPPAQSDRERLERMFDRDQAGRQVLSAVNVAKLPKIQQSAAQMIMYEDDIGSRDRDNQAMLKAMLPPTGWFVRSKYGVKASSGAFVVVQHATDDPDLMHEGLRRMTPFVGTGEIDDGTYALLYDRVAVDFDHKPQRYGTQMTCKDGHWQIPPIEDPDHVDARRKAIGLMMSEADYVKYMMATQPCS